MDIVKVKNETEVIAKLAQLIEEAASKAIAENGVFRIGLSGGSLVKYLAQLAGSLSTDWTKWKLFFCDERYVPHTDADSTFGQYKAQFVPNTKLKLEQFVTLDHSLALADCAHAYEQEIYKEFGIKELDLKSIPKFDLLLLGMGPDGHTCSLFPDHPLLAEENVLIAPIDDSPKPPPKRITMTYPMLNNARASVFAMSGQGKADMVKRILVDKEQLPAGLVKPANDGRLTWILDEAAGEFVQTS